MIDDFLLYKESLITTDPLPSTLHALLFHKSTIPFSYFWKSLAHDLFGVIWKEKPKSKTHSCPVSYFDAINTVESY